ncbi:MAG: hypothetical protein IJ796_07360 [Lachnospiraceae bacterium]|nr:hypothetical protein [Lachnospiraceae bacterium]
MNRIIFDGTERIWNGMYVSKALYEAYPNAPGSYVANKQFINAQREYLQKDIYVDENIEHGSLVVYYVGKENYNGARPGGYGTFKVTPDAGYVLGSVTVTCGDTEIPTSLVEGTTDTHQFVMPDADVNVTAQFNAIGYFVQIYQKEGMTVTTNISDLSKVHVGDEVILTFTPDDPDEFDGIWHISVAKGPYFNGSYVNTEKISDYQYKFTMPAVDVKIDFSYNTKYHNITRVAPYNEWYSSYSNKARSGQEVNMYFYVGGQNKTDTSDLWVKNKDTGEAIDFTFGPGLDNRGLECQKLTYTMPNADVEFCVSFKPQDILLSFPDDMHGVTGKFYVDGEETTVAHKGDTVTVVLDDTELGERYLLATGSKSCEVWYKSSADGTWYCYDSSYMTGNIAGITNSEHEYAFQVELKGYDPELKFTPQFANLYKASIDSNITGGTVSLSADDEYFTEYELVYLEYELDDNEDRVFLGFEVTDADGGEVYVTDYYGDYYFSMPDKDVTVSAKFSVKHAVSLGDCTNGSLSFPNDLESVKMKSGDLVYVVATPAEGYICTGVSAVDSEGNTYDAMWFDPNYVSPIGPINPKGSDGKAGSGGYIPDTGKGGGKDDGFLPIGPFVLDNPTYPDEETFESGNVWSFEMPDDVVTVTATFAEMSSLVFDIDLSAYVNDGLGYEAENYAPWDGQSGSLTLKAGDEVYSDGAAYGQTISLTIEAPEGYCIDSPYVAKRSLNEYAVVGDNIDYTPSDMVYANEDFRNVVGATLTFTMPLSDVDISICFMPITEQNPADP